MNAKKFVAKLGVTFSRLVVLVYDIISFPVFFILDQPWRRWKMQKIIWSKLEREEDPYSCYIRQIHHPDTHLDSVHTMDELFRNAVAQHRHSKCFGTREVLGEEEITVKSGKKFKKLSLGEYKWMTYNEVDHKVEIVSKGLLSLGLKSKTPVVLLAETRVEWIISAQACFRINVPVVTLYATLGEDGLAHGINETEVTHIITSVELLPKLKKVFHLLPRVTHVIYLEGRETPSFSGIPESVKIVSFAELQEAGEKATGDIYSHFEPPQPKDLAILMYTSGSTGIPKGVMITNKNVISTTRGFIDVLGTSIIRPNDVYIAYLPLAHVLELAAECYLSSLGIPVGFSSPQTLTDFSTAVKKGCKGDLKVLQPTLMAAVPLMLDRIRKSILTLAGTEGTFSHLMFDFAIEYKTFWMQRGFRTPLLDRKLLNTYHEFLGGRLKYMLCGGAPISHDTQDFIRSCLDVRVLQGYGMTETAACSTLTDAEDFSTGRVGAPLSTCKIRLVDWDEGGYHVTDKPHPRGEIVVGGDSVTNGYFKNEAQTEENFREEKGIRWFYTGDIGEVMPDGTFKIIDRKKDLVKLQFGEYIALGKVEAELKTCPLVENICTIGNGFHSYLVALVVPNSFHLSALAKEMGKENLTFTELCEDQAVVAKAAKKIREYGQKCRLHGAELPAKVKLCTEEWMPESGLVTAAFKLRRKMIEQHYQHAIEEMYASDTPNGSTKST